MPADKSEERKRRKEDFYRELRERRNTHRAKRREIYLRRALKKEREKS